MPPWRRGILSRSANSSAGAVSNRPPGAVTPSMLSSSGPLHDPLRVWVNSRLRRVAGSRLDAARPDMRGRKASESFFVRERRSSRPAPPARRVKNPQTHPASDENALGAAQRLPQSKACGASGWASLPVFTKRREISRSEQRLKQRSRWAQAAPARFRSAEGLLCRFSTANSPVDDQTRPALARCRFVRLQPGDWLCGRRAGRLRLACPE